MSQIVSKCCVNLFEHHLSKIIKPQGFAGLIMDVVESSSKPESSLMMEKLLAKIELLDDNNKISLFEEKDSKGRELGDVISKRFDALRKMNGHPDQSQMIKTLDQITNKLNIGQLIFWYKYPKTENESTPHKVSTITKEIG